MKRMTIAGSSRRMFYGLSAIIALGAGMAVSGCGGDDAPKQSEAPAQNTAAETDGHGDEAHNLKAHTHDTKIEFNAKSGAPTGGQSDVWTIKVLDAKSGAPVSDFETVHDKLMHLIVVRKDLSWFNHIHPEHQGNGVFTVETTLPSGGAYKIYADYTPKGGEQEVAQHELSAEGVSTAASKLVPDKMQGAWMTKKVAAHPEGEPQAKGGATYEVALMPMPAKLVAGKEAMLHFQVRNEKGQPVKDLQPYLGAMGHCVVLSSDTESYIHSHPTETSGKSDVMFHTTFPEAGVYKAWGQFMHGGKIITAAFVLNVEAGSGEGAAKTADDGHDHAPGTEPHDH